MKKQRAMKPIEQRFWEKVDKHTESGCWEWRSAIRGNGYGAFFTHLIEEGRKCHEAHVDAIHEWAERAKIAEAVLEKLLNEREKQKPEVWMDANDDVFFTEADAYKTGIAPIRGLYTSPPASKPWVGLTDEEVFDVWLNEMPAPDKVFYQKLCRSVEAKLKEKNT